MRLIFDSLGKRLAVAAALAMVVGGLAMVTALAEAQLSKDDVTLLLLGSAPASKIISIVEQRGVDFQMTPDLAKTFHDQGATDDVIDALQKAGQKAAQAKQSAPAASPSPQPAEPAPPPAASPHALGASSSPAEAPSSAPPDSESPTMQRSSSDGSSSEPVLHTRRNSSTDESSGASAPTPAPSASSSSSSASSSSSSEPVLHQPAGKNDSVDTSAATSNSPGLKDPDAQGIQHIIQEFAAKEKVFRAARDNYTYHQVNKVEELGAGDEIVGTYEQEWDILYDDNGNRIEKVTYAPLNTLKNLIVTKEDLEGFRNIQPFVLTTDELPEYEVKYLGHVAVDKITAYVFSIRPKEMEKNKQYFQGTVWVDDRDLQIVKTEGKQVPEAKVHHGQENLFPRFTTWREQVDGKFWFPTFTKADDVLYFSNAPSVHMREIVRYTDYKQFKSGARILQVKSIDKPDQPAQAPTTPKQ